LGRIRANSRKTAQKAAFQASCLFDLITAFFIFSLFSYFVLFVDKFLKPLSTNYTKEEK